MTVARDRPRVRRANEADAVRVASWFSNRAEAVQWAGTEAPRLVDPLWLEREFEREDVAHFVMVDTDDTAVGVFGLRFHKREKRAHLVRVAIDPDRRGEGLSAVLMRAAIDLSRDERMLRLTLNVFASNEAARAAYERAGFFTYEFARSRVDPTGWMLRMLKPL